MEVRVCLVRSRILVGHSYTSSRAEVVYLSGYFELVVVSGLFGTKTYQKFFFVTISSKCWSAHSMRAIITGINECPVVVREYSTFGGTTG